MAHDSAEMNAACGQDTNSKRALERKEMCAECVCVLEYVLRVRATSVWVARTSLLDDSIFAQTKCRYKPLSVGEAQVPQLPNPRQQSRTLLRLRSSPSHKTDSQSHNKLIIFE